MKVTLIDHFVCFIYALDQSVDYQLKNNKEAQSNNILRVMS